MGILDSIVLGGVAGGSQAVGRNAASRMKEEALRKRDDHLATIRAGERSAGETFQTSARIAGETFQTSARIARETFQTSARIAGETFQTSARIAGETARSTEADRIFGKESERYGQQQEEGRKNRAQEAKLQIEKVIETNNKLKIPLERTYDFLIRQDVDADVALAAVLNTLKKTGDKTDLDQRKLYSTVYNAAMKSLTSDHTLPETPEMIASASKRAFDIAGWKPKGGAATPAAAPAGEPSLLERMVSKGREITSAASDILSGSATPTAAEPPKEPPPKASRREVEGWAKDLESKGFIRDVPEYITEEDVEGFRAAIRDLLQAEPSAEAYRSVPSFMR